MRKTKIKTVLKCSTIDSIAEEIYSTP